MPLCQLFINKKKDQFMLMKMPDKVNPDNYQDWIKQKEQENEINAFTFSQKLLDAITLKYVGDYSENVDSPYQAKYVLIKAPDENQLFVSSLELSQDGDEKLDVVRSGLLIVFDEDELKHFTAALQDVWNQVNN